MAKKTLDGIEDNNRNLGGVSALFNAPTKESTVTKSEKQGLPSDDDIVTYPLRLKKSALKALKILGAQQGITVKDLIMKVVEKEYDL
ncbi:hypothetical protein [Pedobacter gandavensis]|uniref:hypothetical protein n=1 Tax=Pedobacter gandavensis TaxID=2679963 RepID=UPI002931A124|nr:hypothetical protein [Pedobacter gandavensis]